MECWSTEMSQFQNVLEAIGDFRKANDLNEIHLFEDEENQPGYGIAMAPRTHGIATYFFDAVNVNLNSHHLPYFLAETANLRQQGRDKLHGWFGLSYASFLTLPRILMQEMPDEWQEKMADLLAEYDEAFPNKPPVGSRVQVTDLQGRLIKTPAWLINYRRPDYKEIDALRRRDGQ